MPEGPTIVLMKENICHLIGKKVEKQLGSQAFDEFCTEGKILQDIQTFGKQTFLIFDDFIIKIHLKMFGSYSLSERTDIQTLRLALIFDDASLYFYTCEVSYDSPRFLENIMWKTDIMGARWSDDFAKYQIKKEADSMICDVLLNQKIFSGVGNIIKSEALFRAKIHPERLVKDLSEEDIQTIISAAKSFSEDFKTWKKAGILRKNLLVYQQKTCSKCSGTFTVKTTGKTKRKSFFCEADQI